MAIMRNLSKRFRSMSLVGLLAMNAGCSESDSDEGRGSDVNISPASNYVVPSLPVELADTAKQASEIPIDEAVEMFKIYERAKRDELYQSFFDEDEGEGSMISVLGSLPTTCEYNDHSSMDFGGSKYSDIMPFVYEDLVGNKVGPEFFLFHAMRLINCDEDKTHPYQLVREVRSNISSRRDFLEEKAVELGLVKFREDYPEYLDYSTFRSREVEDIFKGGNSGIIYDSIRNTNRFDLRLGYKFVDEHLPESVKRPLSKNLKSSVNRARELMSETVKREVTVDSEKTSEMISYRLDNGDFYLDRVDFDPNGPPIQAHETLVLPIGYDQETPFAKWLYRRGEPFITNFEIMVDLYGTSSNASEFSERVLETTSGIK